MSDVAIRCVNVTKRYGDVTAVDSVSISLPTGCILALLGPSGCGKTTTLRLLAGFEVPEAGSIEIGGRVMAGNGSFIPPEKRRVGMVFQDYALFPHLDVARNVAYGLTNSNHNGSRVSEILALVGLSDLERRMPHELSGGQQQRVALARALAPGPEVILLDEPFSNLDAELRARVRAEVRDILLAARATAVFVTHDQEEALSLADEVALMLEGRIVQVADPEGLYRRPASRAAATFVGDSDFLAGKAANGQVSCELGLLRCENAYNGNVEVMVRPENVDFVADSESPHEVVLREFFGHDQLVTVRLASGRKMRSRLAPSARFAPGDRVRIQVRETVTVFPA
ncbi:MAG: ABC transporter ATP-binding protein [Chloroflexi bacterium]|nr:ABC transporter ATP-binding protein [Chloroflexota bacterium]